MARRKGRTQRITVRPYGRLGYALAFDGQERPLCFPTDPEEPKPWPLAELRKAWDAYRDRHIEESTRRGDDRPCWAELVFDEGMEPDEARTQIEARQEARSDALRPSRDGDDESR